MNFHFIDIYFFKLASNILNVFFEILIKSNYGYIVSFEHVKKKKVKIFPDLSMPKWRGFVTILYSIRVKN